VENNLRKEAWGKPVGQDLTDRDETQQTIHHTPDGGTEAVPVCIPPPAARLRFDARARMLYPDQKISVGRSADADIPIADPRVSRSHAGIEWNGMGFTLRDLGSINGTYVNGQRLAEGARVLRDGDEIEIGRCRLVYEIARSEPPAPISGEQLATQAAARTTGPRLVVSSGPDQGQIYPLWGEEVTIGRASRDATWEIRLTDRSVSRPHARLQKSADGYLLMDLESANGTLLNGRAILAPQPITAADTITVGATHMIFYP
jgi:pSer/pThr/pTyr-binding forkhead associated (FHA) protein